MDTVNQQLCANAVIIYFKQMCTLSAIWIEVTHTHTHARQESWREVALGGKNTISRLESSAGGQKGNGEKTEMVWARHEDGRRSRSEESDDESDTGEKEEWKTKAKVEGCVQEGHADCRTERGR